MSSGGFVDCCDFEESALTSSEFKQNERVPSQLVCYLSYRYPNIPQPKAFSFRTPLIKMSCYGIPKISEFIKDDSARMFIKVPLDTTQEQAMPFINFINRLDKWVENNKETIFGSESVASKYEINPLAKDPPVIDEDAPPKLDKNGKPYEEGPRHKYVKVRLNTDYDTGKIITHIYVRKSDDPEARPEKIYPETVTELTKYLTWNSSIRMVVTVTKLWGEKTKKDAKAKFKQAGLILKVMNMEIIPNTKQSMTVDFSGYAFD